MSDYKKNDISVYLTLFTSIFKISAFTFGGGFVIVPLMKKRFVNDLNWINEDEMIDIAAIAQSSPGAIAVNAAILLGYRIAGLLGAIVCIIGAILPPFIIIAIISYFYSAFRDNRIIRALLKGMQVGVAAVVLDVSVGMAHNIVKTKKAAYVLMMIAAFVATFIFDINIIIIILCSAFLGIIATLYESRKGKDDN
ncbi:MAG TPA: chromate transporter [Clostridiales bacterium]|nr:chromate transporter [Clostridiales bacterium]